MKAKASATALKLINLYRQEHVIIGGWAALNPIFLHEATNDVLAEMSNLPNGRKLAQHIQNLRSGVTKMDSVERELLPYGGAMADTITSVKLTNEQWHELANGIAKFTPDQQGLDMIQSLNVVKMHGEEWPIAIKNALTTRPDLQNKWNAVMQTYNAYRIWDSANEIVSNPLTERICAQVQADIPEYETYLPMFGDTGEELLKRLRTCISTAN
jgi:hypothetical protein